MEKALSSSLSLSLARRGIVPSVGKPLQKGGKDNFVVEGPPGEFKEGGGATYEYSSRAGRNKMPGCFSKLFCQLGITW